MANIFITADWHLAENSWAKRPEIYGDAFESLKRLCALCGAKDHILAAGDLFDTKHPTAATVVATKEILSKHVSWPIKFIQGQHEASKVPWLKVANADHIDGKHTRFPGSIRVYALDWTLGLHLQEKLNQIGELFRHNDPLSNGYNILMLHQTCTAVLAGTDDQRDKRLASLEYRGSELKDGMIPGGFDLIIVGDTHVHTEFQLRDVDGKLVRCLSPGSFAMQSIVETNVGQCFVLDTDTLNIKSLDLYRRPYKEVEILTPVAFDQEIRKCIKDPVLEHFDIPITKYTIYEKDADRIASLIQACINKAFPFFYVVESEASNTVQDVQVIAKSTDELVSAAINEADASDTAKSLLNDLINSNSADEVLDSYYRSIVLRSKC